MAKTNIALTSIASTSIASVGMALCAGWWPTAAAAAAGRAADGHDAVPVKPNIVFILLDDLDLEVTGPYLDEVLPQTSALRGEGVVFPNAFVTTPICGAARASLLTGRYGHNTGVLTNGGSAGGYDNFRSRGNEQRTVAYRLQAAGYETGAFGKYINGYTVDDTGRPPAVAPGWSDWHVFVDRDLASYKGYNYALLSWRAGGGEAAVDRYGVEPADYSTDVVRDEALAFIDRAVEKHRPFFAFIAPTAPHFPLPAAPRHQQQALKWVTSFPRERGNLFSDGDTFDDKPLWLRSTLDLRLQRQAKVWNTIDWANRLGSLYAVDELVAATVAKLKATGQWNHTVLIVTSDNGYNLGAHGLLQKMAPYEESIRVPLWVASGRDLGLRQGVTDERWVLNIDMAPTLLALAGAPSDQDMDGRSFKPWLERGPASDAPRQDFLLEYSGAEAGSGIDLDVPAAMAPSLILDLPSYRGIRAQVTTGRDVHDYLYVEWLKDADPSKGPMQTAHEFELYDLTEDPLQLRNLIFYQGTETALVQNLQTRLEQLVACQGERCQ